MFYDHRLISKASKETLERIRTSCNFYIGRTRINTIKYFDSYIEYILKRYTKERTTYDFLEGHKYDLIIKKKNKL